MYTSQDFLMGILRNEKIQDYQGNPKIVPLLADKLGGVVVQSSTVLEHMHQDCTRISRSALVGSRGSGK